MVKVAFRGKGTRGGGSASASGGSGRGGGGSASASGETKRLSASASGETKRVSASASGGSRRGRGRGGGRSEAPAGGSDRTRGRGTENYIPLRDLPTVAAAKRYEAAKRDKDAKRDKARGKRVASTNDTVVRLVATRATANVGDTLGTFADAPDGGGSPPARPRTNGGSSNYSNPSPPSQGTRVSQSNLSASRGIPLQYPPSTNPSGGLDEIQRDDEEDDEEEDRGDEEEPEGDDGLNDDLAAEFEVVDDHQPEGLDDKQMLANLLAPPRGERLPLLSEVHVSKSLW